MYKIHPLQPQYQLESLVNISDEIVFSDVIISDIVSHVLTKGKSGDLWLTTLSHANVIAAAFHKGIKYVVITDGMLVSDDVVLLARKYGIYLARTKRTAFEFIKLILVC